MGVGSLFRSHFSKHREEKHESARQKYINKVFITAWFSAVGSNSLETLCRLRSIYFTLSCLEARIGKWHVTLTPISAPHQIPIWPRSIKSQFLLCCFSHVFKELLKHQRTCSNRDKKTPGIRNLNFYKFPACRWS